MKKLFCVVSIIFILLLGSYCLAADEDEYTLLIDYSQEVFKDVPIQADVKLIGSNATPYTTVRVKVDISGPSVPKLMATDSAGQQWDIAQLGYWGPPEGFAVGGTFTNTTPVTATFKEAGLYEIKLSLVNVADSTVIADSTTSIYVYNDESELNTVTNQIPTNNSVSNNIIAELPQTGRSITEYIIYTFAMIAIIVAGYVLIRKNK